MRPGKPIIGLAGGIGSGKSTVAKILGELGAGVVSSDALGHEELDDPEVQRELKAWWGPEIVLADGHVDREALRQRIASDPGARRRLEELLHPPIGRKRRQLTERYFTDPSKRAVVWDSPLLFEAGLAGECTRIIFVDADPRIRAERVAAARGWSAEELERLEKSQKALDFKEASADYKVVNNSDVDSLRHQVEEVFSRILSGA